MTYFATRNCDCTVTTGTGQRRPEACELHGNRYQTDAELNPPERKPINRVSEKRQAEIDAGERHRTGSTLSQGRGMSAAPAQRQKVRGLACIGCGLIIEPDTETNGWVIDAAHLLPRRLGGCDHPLCAGPLCRNEITLAGCHPAFEEDKLDLLAKLVDRGYFAELGHMITAHRLSPLTVVKELTGEEHLPAAPFVREAELLRAEVVQLQAAIAA